MRYAAPVPSSITKLRPKNPDKLNRPAIFRAAPIIVALSTNRTTVAGPVEVSVLTASQLTPARTSPFQQTTAQLAGLPRTNDWATTVGRIRRRSYHCLSKIKFRSRNRRLISRMSPIDRWKSEK